jgi:hypothetical protein
LPQAFFFGRDSSGSEGGVICDKTVFVLTDTPKLYGDELNRDRCVPVFVKSVPALLDKLRNVEAAGLVLEIGKVMRATRAERDRLFSYSACFPIMRTKPNPRHGFMAYLDPKALFLANVDDTVGKRKRSHERTATSLPCHFAREDDPSLAAPLSGTILDISPGGSFIEAPTAFTGESFLNIRIPGLSNPRPIFSSVRWHSTSEARPGFGVMFIDIAQDQVHEIAQRQNQSRSL